MNSRISTKIAVLVGAVSAVLFAGQVITFAETLPVKSYTTSDGLAHDRVNRIVRDSRGFLWFCTSEGLSRFDGYEFKNYTQDDGLPHRAVLDLLETKAGEYWVATSDGLVLFDPKGISDRGHTAKNDENLKMFRTFRPDKLDPGSTTWAVNDLLEDRDGAVWVASSIGLYKIIGPGELKFEHHDIPAARSKQINEIQHIIEDRKGAIWAGSLLGLYRIAPDRSEVETIAANIRVESLLETSDGNVWVGSAGGDEASTGVHVFSNGEEWPHPIRVFRKSDGLSDDLWMNSLFQTRDGRILVGVAKGLCEYTPNVDPKLPQFRILSNESIIEIGEDVSGNVWFSTNSSGVRRLSPNGFVSYRKNDGLDGDSIASIISAAGETYVLTSHFKISRFNGLGFDTRQPNKMIAGNWSTGQITFPDHTGAWWVGGASGLQRYPSVKEFSELEKTRPLKTYTTATADGLFTNDVFQLFEDSRGDIWISLIGSVNSILRWERTTDRIHGYTAAEGLPTKNAAVAFGEDLGGNIWLGFYYGGLFRFHNGKFESYSEADGLPPGTIRNIFTDSTGRLWVATSSGGVVRINDPTTEEKPPIERLTTSDGLSSNQTTCTTEDSFGRIYISTGRGVNRIDVRTGKIKVFSQADGLPENIITQCKRAADGALWFGTFNGIARYVPMAEAQREPPPVFLSNLFVNGESVRKLSELGEAKIVDLDLGSDQRQIQIDFFALGFGTGESLRYQYKLDGDWSVPTADRTVNLNLSSGKYQFMVRAVSADGVISDTTASVSFTIARPVWQRWWFLLILAFVFAGLIYSFYRYRLKRLLELEKVRIRIATDLHDDIGSSLSQIAILSEVVRQKVGNKEVNEPLNMIADTSREMVDSMSDIVWAINPDKDHLSDLVQRMRRFAFDILEASDIACRFTSNEAHNKTSLGTDVRREVYLIFKECINNLVKHAAATEAAVAVNIENSFLAVRINDNGKGFDMSTATTSINGFGGNGLVNIQRRAEGLGGSLSIKSEVGKGTSIDIRVPVKR